MSRPFSERVAHDDWRREATQWIHVELDRRGIEVVGAIEQPRIRPWSTQLTVPTDGGRVWFKANCAYMAFEPALQARLARTSPGAVDAPLAIDVDRGWMLTSDRGPTLGDTAEASEADWRTVLAGAARVQRDVADDEDEMLALGLPDCRPNTVVGRFDRFLEVFGALPAEHPAHVPPGLGSQLAAVRGRVAEAADELETSGLPTTWQHGDLHPWNVFAADGRFFDLGDGQWAHAAEVLGVPHGWITQQGATFWPQVLEAYADAWDLSLVELESVWRAVCLTQPVNRTLLWWGCLQDATAAEWSTWGDGVLNQLTRVLDA